METVGLRKKAQARVGACTVHMGDSIILIKTKARGKQKEVERREEAKVRTRDHMFSRFAKLDL